MPVVIPVTSLADSGPGSLRQAILDANADPGPDVINFAPEVRGTILLVSGQLDITDDLTIDGPGADDLDVSGNDASRVFQIGSSVRVDMIGLTITHGRSDNGGGIWNAGGTLTLTQVVVANNQALGAPGVETGAGVSSTTVEADRHAQHLHEQRGRGGQPLPDSFTHGRGGAIANDSGAMLVVAHSTFSHNQAIGGDGAPGVVGGNGVGGAILNRVDCTAFVSHSTFSDNRAVGGAGTDRSGGVGGGGGIHNARGATLTVSHSTFSHNQAIGGAAGPGRTGNAGGGGGISNEESTLAVAHRSFIDNRATGGIGGSGAAGGNGFAGGISNAGIDDIANLSISHSQ